MIVGFFAFNRWHLVSFVLVWFYYTRVYRTCQVQQKYSPQAVVITPFPYMSTAFSH